MADNKKSSGSGPPQDRGKKRSKSYFVRSREGKRIRKDTMLSVGMRGFLLTCNHGVNPCIKEAYNLLSEYADKLYGPEKDEDEEDGKMAATESGGDDDDDDCEDMEASLRKEIAGMKRKRRNKQQRFQAIDSGAKNVAFIKSKIADPCHLVHHILTDIQEKKTSKSRHIMRMLPVTATYRSYIEDIEKQAGQTLKPHFELEGGKPLSFSIVFKVRNCGHLKRDETITTLHRMVTDMGNHTVDLTNPDRVILVEGVRNVCCISVLTDFYKLRKYNLQTIMERDTNGEAARYDAKRRKPAKVTGDGATGADGDATEQSGDKQLVPTDLEPSENKEIKDEAENGESQAKASEDRTDLKTNKTSEDKTDGKINEFSEDNTAQTEDKVGADSTSQIVAEEQNIVKMTTTESSDIAQMEEKVDDEVKPGSESEEKVGDEVKSGCD